MSRDLKDLLLPARRRTEAFIAACDAQGIDVLITSTLRTNAEQSELYAQGRTKPGKIVTNAKAGQSWHNYGLAFDCVPIRHGKPVWGTTGDGIDDNPSDDDKDDLELWQRVGAIGEGVGLQWAGRWTGGLREFAHFQFTDGLTLADLQAGKRPRPDA